MFKWIVWNVDRACPVGDPIKGFRNAITAAMALEARDDEHFTVVPA